MEQLVICAHPDHMYNYMPALQAFLTSQMVYWWPVNSVIMPTLHPKSPPTPKLHRVHGCHSLTSIIVFAVTTGGLHGCVTASSSPAQLADTVPPIQVQGASAIAIAQPRATLCKAKHTELRSDRPWPIAVTHIHTLPANLQNAFTSHQHIGALSTQGGW